MAGQLCITGETFALNILFRNTGTTPTKIYVGLTTATLTDTATMTNCASREEDDAGYSRKTAVFTAPAAGTAGQTIENSAAIVFGPWSSQATTAIKSVFLCDISSGSTATGTVLAWATLTANKRPAAGETLTFATAALTIAME